METGHNVVQIERNEVLKISLFMASTTKAQNIIAKYRSVNK